MTLRLPVVLLCVGLAACNSSSPKQPAKPPRPLNTQEKIVRAALRTIASDGKPVCVERITYGRPLTVYRIATQGRLQNVYALGWYPPQPIRPPEMPTIGDMRRDVNAKRNADLPEPLARTDGLPKARQAEIDAAAIALSAPGTPLKRVAIRPTWAPQGVFSRLWPAKNVSRGCTAEYNLSTVKWNDKLGFVAVRVDHWGTIYAVAPEGDDWKTVAQWGYWLY